MKLLAKCDWCGNEITKSDRHGKVLYRKIAEQKLGRVLTINEVQHIDGEHYNNDSSNLLVISRNEHMKIYAMRKRRQEW